MSAGTGEYGGIAETLCQRILALIPEHPEIMELESVWDLHGVEGFDCSDLNPSLAQASGALSKARALAKQPGRIAGEG